MIVGRLLATGALCVIATICTAAAFSARAATTASALDPRSVARAQTIRAQLDATYRAMPAGRGLAVTEATSTGVVESFTLLTPDLLGARFLPADNGIWYAICPVRATCPYPARRFARPAADLVSRRLALELALRTFLEATTSVVAVSLPTSRFIAFVVEREELAREVDVAALARALSGNPARTLSSSLRAIVDRVTRERVYVFTGLEPAPNGRSFWAGIPLWLSGSVTPASAEDRNAATCPEPYSTAGSDEWVIRAIRPSESTLRRRMSQRMLQNLCDVSTTLRADGPS